MYYEDLRDRWSRILFVSCYAETYAVGLRELKTARYVYLLSRRERSEHRDDDTTDVLIQALSHLVEDQTGQKTY